MAGLAVLLAAKKINELNRLGLCGKQTADYALLIRPCILNTSKQEF